jgi:hypothetical protein
VIPFDYEHEKGKVENLCKRLADSEVEIRDAVLDGLPKYIREVCVPFVRDGALDKAEQAAVEGVDLGAHDAGQKLWDGLLKDPSAAKLALLFEKLCLGLYYCMWHSDKPLVQHECALKLARLLEAPPTPLLKDLFLRSFLRTLAAHWGKVDQWRVDKYMALVRKMCYQVFQYLVATVQDAKPPVVAANSAATSSSSPAKKKARATKSSKSDGIEANGDATDDAEARAMAAALDPTAIVRHPTMLRTAATFQYDVIRGESVGLTMHICDLVLTELLRCENMKTPLFVAVSLAIPLYAMQRGDYMEKRVMDQFVVPIAAGQLEKRSVEFSLETTTVLAGQLEHLSVSRATHFKVRPLFVESQRLMDNYVGLQTSPDMFEPVTRRDERRRLAEEIRAAEDIKMRMSRLAMKHAAAAGAVRAVRRSTKPTQPSSKRNARWKK